MRFERTGDAGGAAGPRCRRGGRRAVAERQRELVRLVRQDCGSCHGMTLAGGLGPPLLRRHFRDAGAGPRPDVLPRQAGHADCPPGSGSLDETEAQWIVDRLLAGFPAQ